jgi:hypothetical protein
MIHHGSVHVSWPRNDREDIVYLDFAVYKIKKILLTGESEEALCKKDQIHRMLLLAVKIPNAGF